MPGVPAQWPTFSKLEREAVDRVLASGKVNYWTGTEGRNFESEFASGVGVAHAAFVANGTVALELALRALELQPGSEVVTSPFTFIATASAIIAAGHKPVFADVDPCSGNITAQSIESVLTESTAAVLVVHIGGWPADMVKIAALCELRGLRLIEDCAQAHGARIGDRHVGTFSDISAWSFCTDKIVSTGGEGGMVTTNDRALWERMWSYKDHGKSWSAVYERDHPPGFRWLHETFGTNWRATEMQAAIGRVQYRELPETTRQRTANAQRLVDLLHDTPGLRIPTPPPGIHHAFYRLYAYVQGDALLRGWNRDRIIAEVNSRSEIPISTGSSAEIYLERAFIAAGLGPPKPLPIAAHLRKQSLAFIVHPGISITHLTEMAAIVRTVVARATDHGPRANDIAT